MSKTVMAAVLVLALAAAPSALQAESQERLTEGRLGDGDPREVDTGEGHIDYQVAHLEAGRRYRISVGSSYFYPTITFHRPGDNEALVQADNYRDPGDRGPRVIYSPAETGDYELTITADPGSGEGEGNYAVLVETLPPLRAPLRAEGGTAVQSGWAIYEGELTSEDPDRDGYVDYALSMRAGETRLFLAEATQFGPQIWIARSEAPDGDPVAGGGGGTDNFSLALTSFTAPRDDTYLIRVTTEAGGGTGHYRLRISDPLVPAPPAPSGETSAE